MVRPWVYKSLAIALRQSGGAADEIERAEMSSAELEPLDAQGYLDASRAMAGDKRWDRALAFAKQAAVLEPNTPYAYNEALLYAESAKDVDGMEWAAGHLLRQDWPVSNQELQGKAIHTAQTIWPRRLNATTARTRRRRSWAPWTSQRQRDLVFKLSWQGDADLDLKVKEPTGSVCWVLNRQTIGGGTMTGDAQSDRNSETYQAAKAFSGDYEVTVDRVWGTPLSNKAQLKIIRHQGTPQQSEELVTVDLKNGGAVKVNLADGRRNEVGLRAAAVVGAASERGGRQDDRPLQPDEQAAEDVRAGRAGRDRGPQRFHGRHGRNAGVGADFHDSDGRRAIPEQAVVVHRQQLGSDHAGDDGGRPPIRAGVDDAGLQHRNGRQAGRVLQRYPRLARAVIGLAKAMWEIERPAEISPRASFRLAASRQGSASRPLSARG